MPVEIGYGLSSEEHGPHSLVRNAVRAEELGFTFASISDHFHPWIRRQGHSGFVWSVVGAIAQATERIHLGTGVTCPTVRTHPAVIAQAAATSACLMPGRFFLGVGSGEALNEHIVGERWPPAPIRLAMLEEAVQVMRLLWQGGSQDHHGTYYTLEDATIFDLPDELPSIIVAASGPQSATVAGRVGDGMWSVAPDPESVEVFEGESGPGKPKYAQVVVCWGQDERKALQTAREEWPNVAITGQLTQDLPTPEHFEQAAQMITEDMVSSKVACGPDPARFVEMVQKYVDAGYTHLYLQQVGDDQEGFFRFWEEELRSALIEEGLLEP
jgi:coenzyme F420-dependent glucose-6-phosphate dehydrogenase